MRIRSSIGHHRDAEGRYNEQRVFPVRLCKTSTKSIVEDYKSFFQKNNMVPAQKTVSKRAYWPLLFTAGPVFFIGSMATLLYVLSTLAGRIFSLRPELEEKLSNQMISLTTFLTLFAILILYMGILFSILAPFLGL